MTVTAKRQSQAERRETSERKLFDALITIINRDGIQAATCERIADEAGYSPGMVIQRLGRRDQMFARLVDRLTAAQRATLARLGVDHMPAADAMRTYIDVHFDDLERDAGYNAYFVLVAGTLTVEPSLKPSVDGANRMVRDIMTGFIQRGQREGDFPAELDAVDHAIRIGCLMMGAAIQHRLLPDMSLDGTRDAAKKLIPA